MRNSNRCPYVLMLTMGLIGLFMGIILGGHENFHIHFLEVLFVILRHKVYLYIRKIATFVIVICSNVWNYEKKNALAIRKMSFGGCSN